MTNPQHTPEENAAAQRSENAAEKPLLLGTRGSLLATTQSGHVKEAVEARGESVEFHIVHTPGDASQASQIPVAAIGVGVFTETLRTALHDGECDIAVHSFKDLPTAPDPRFRTVVPKRVDPREVLVSRDGSGLMDLPAGAKVGTSAPRRVSQVRALRPDLELVPLRGNVGTRMDRVNQDLDAVILARAGLERIGQLERAAESIDPMVLIPAPAQGALSVEVRCDDQRAWTAVRALDHLPSHIAAVAERAVLATLEAGCSAPVAVRSEWTTDGQQLTVTGGVFAVDGSQQLVESRTEIFDLPAEMDADGHHNLDHEARERILVHARALGSEVGRTLIDRGAARIVAAT
ncbi:hydroxymethylbilane synthase [Corynebacterium sp. zg254]|uniref:Hydroxymethylbilane synthase n=1 Tax=Corynebacterium zhongnanshanii TaxID=2768834 RepID=A0ABQ6VEA4_9CORY|nr:MULTISPECIES: hydroxymethylbilane synthase [Corynebacterium]KAB3522724.1 hydroxymethylbilane synthase [Corynebacterium zhongnanshanii]MCR5914219.1 hydroxymethylbilane synthase [Corynebacterium sp. zg254]